MFYVVISEKGGSQKRLEFDKKEITIGRVQGNDIILPKGNVSKRHSRIVLKDGKFIIVDLKSTNGTFVNGRKISSPQMVKSSDRIYVGDFTMSVEEYEGEAGNIAADDVPSAPAPLGTNPPPAPAPPSPPARPPSAAATPIVPRVPVSSPTPPPEPRRPNPTPPPSLKPIAVSSAPASNSGKLSNGSIPKPPLSSGVNRTTPRPQALETPVQAVRPIVVTPPAPVRAAPVAAKPLPPPRRKAYLEPLPPPGDAREPLLRAKSFLLEKLGQQMDITAYHQVTPSLLDATKKRLAELFRVHKEALSAVSNTSECIEEVCQEALGLGPLGAFLRDDAVTEVFVNGPYQITTSAGGVTRAQGAAFGTELGLLCAIDRLLRASGRRLSFEATSLDVRLRDGTQLLASFPPISTRGTTLVLRKGAGLPEQGNQAMLPELIAAGALPENAAAFLEVCVRARLSILISGGPDSGRSRLLQAFSYLLSPEERVGVLLDGSSLSILHPQAFTLSRQALSQALQLGATRLVVKELRPERSFELARMLSTRADGALVSTTGQNTQEAFDRVSSYAHLGAPSATLEAVRELVGRAFSLIVHTMRFSDGSKRVVQISEVCQVLDEEGNPMMAPSDLFIWDGERLAPTKQVPQFWPMLEARGEVNSTAFFE